MSNKAKVRQASAYPSELKSRPQWVAWRIVEGNKLPVNPRTGGLAKVNDPTTWGTFEEAQAEAASPRGGRVGFVFTDTDPFVALDFDECLDEAGNLTARGRELVNPFIGKAYVARSQSGRGIHVVTEANAAHTGNRKAEAGVEVYVRSRFLALTGDVYEDSGELGRAQAEVDALVSKVWGERPGVPAANEPMLVTSGSWPTLAEEFRKTVAALGVLGEALQAEGTLSYGEWIESVVMPLQGTFGATPLEPVIKRLFAEFTRKLPGYRPGDETKLDRFSRITGPRRTMATVYSMADRIAPGWRQLLAEGDASEERGSDAPTSFDRGGDALDGDLEPPRFVIRPYFPKGRFVLIAGPHGSFKSLIGLDAALAAGAGTQWGGSAETERTRSGFASLEDPTDTIRRRIRAFQKGGPFDGEAERAAREEAIRERVFYLGAEKLRGMYLTDVERGTCRIRKTAIDAWVTLLNGEGIGFAILETASRLHRGAETNEVLPRFTDAVEEILDRSRYELALGIIHHTSQEDARKRRVDSYVGRGATTTADRARGVLAIERTDRSNLPDVRVTHEKAGTDSPRGDALMWQPEVNSVGIYLRPVTVHEAVGSDADALLAHIEAEGGEVTERALGDAKRVPEKLSIRNHRGRMAVQRLLEEGRVERLENVPRGKTRATVYRSKRQS